MKRNPRFEERRKTIPKEIDVFINRSFDIVDRIHEILDLKKLTQKDLAKLLEKKESEVSKWMTGTHNFTLKTLTKIETVLGYPIIKVINIEIRQANQPFLFIIENKYAQTSPGNDVQVRDISEMEIKQKFLEPISYLS